MKLYQNLHFYLVQIISYFAFTNELLQFTYELLTLLAFPFELVNFMP